MEIFGSDDYAGVIVDDIDFYYGYEKTVNDGIDEEDPKWDEDDEWCFVASVNDEEIARLTTTEIENSHDGRLSNTEAYLLAGIAILIKRGTLQFNI